MLARKSNHEVLCSAFFLCERHRAAEGPCQAKKLVIGGERHSGSLQAVSSRKHHFHPGTGTRLVRCCFRAPPPMGGHVVRCIRVWQMKLPITLASTCHQVVNVLNSFLRQVKRTMTRHGAYFHIGNCGEQLLGDLPAVQQNHTPRAQAPHQEGGNTSVHSVQSRANVLLRWMP